MRTALGLILVLAGAAVMLYGLGTALLELIGLYQGAMSDPLTEPAVSEKETSKAMIRAAIIGAAGIPFFIVGSVLLKITLFQRWARGRRG